MEDIKKALDVLDNVKVFWSPSQIQEIELAIQALQKLMPLKEHLKKIEELEDEVIMTDDCWIHGYCSLTEEITEKWLVLKEERDILLYT